MPALSVADSCGFPPAMAPDVEFAIVQVPPLDGPTPRPSGLVVAGETAVSVTATFPADATEKVKTSEPLGASAPLNVSVVAVLDDGEDGLPNRLLSGFVHAEVIAIDARTRSDENSRRSLILPFSACRGAAVSAADRVWIRLRIRLRVCRSDG